MTQEMDSTEGGAQGRPQRPGWLGLREMDSDSSCPPGQAIPRETVPSGEGSKGSQGRLPRRGSIKAKTQGLWSQLQAHRGAGLKANAQEESGLVGPGCRWHP